MRKAAVSGRRFWKEQFVEPVRNQPLLKYFWILGGIFGLLIVFLTPPLMGFDETTHFKATTYLIEGSHDAAPRQDTVKPAFIDKDSADAADTAGAAQAHQTVGLSLYKYFLTHDYNSGEMRTIDLSGAAVYSPISYVPTVVGVGIAKLVQLPLLFQMWAGRIANLAIYLVLAYFALRLIPFAKWALFIVALLPMSLFQAATITTDGFLNGLSFLFAALVFYLMRSTAIDPGRLRWLLGSLGALSIIIAFCKPTYVLFLALLLLIPIRHFAGKRQKFIYIGVVAALALACAVLWNLHVKEYALAMGSVYRYGFFISSQDQIQSLLHHPTHFITVPVRTILQSGYGYFGQMVGVFDPRFTAIPIILSLPLVGALFVAVNQDAKAILALGRNRRVFIGLVIAAVFAAIAATFYLTYTPVGSVLVDGMQGRYFLPLLGLGLPLLASKRIATMVRQPERLYVPLMVVLLVVACLQIPYVNYWMK